MKHSLESKPAEPYKVFVSSTFLDNRERRRLVADAITQAGMVWHGMDIFTANTRPAASVCERYAREADLLAGIIAWRYGSCPPESEKYFTELDYDAAKVRLMIIVDPQLPINPETDFDPGPDRWDQQKNSSLSRPVSTRTRCRPPSTKPRCRQRAVRTSKLAAGPRGVRSNSRTRRRQGETSARFRTRDRKLPP